MTVHTPLRADDVRRSYARWAGHYDFTFALFGRKYVKKVVNRLNDETHGNQVLDVGCGTGVAQSRLPFRLLPLTAGFRNRQLTEETCLGPLDMFTLLVLKKAASQI